MVKNVKGGSNHKRFARKNLSNKGPQRTRLADELEPCEMYAIVTKMFGQGVCEVKCNDNVLRQCIIRKKFSGRNKQSNMINVGVKVLVGLRDWEVLREGKMPKCDLLEVYNNNDVKMLKKEAKINWEILVLDDELSATNEIEFDYDDNEEGEEELFETKDISGNIDDICLDDI